MPGTEKQRDFWDKVDILSKLLSGVVLALIALVIKWGTDEIAASHRRGDLVRSLISDLTTKEARTRQDLALIALNHSVGDQNARLMTEIAERLVVDTSGYAAGDRAAIHALESVAFQILRERDSTRAKAVQQVLERRFEVRASSDSTTRAALRSTPDPAQAAAPTPTADSSAIAVADIIAPIESKVAFIQFQGRVTRETMHGLRAELNRNGFVAPDVERVVFPFNSAVRYFHPEDRAVAESAAAHTLRYLREKGLVTELPVRDYSNRGFRSPPGQIEVWISIR